MVSKETFLRCIDLIKEKDRQQTELSDILEKMSPGSRCDALVYCEYSDMLLNILKESLGDEFDLICYKFYEFDEFDQETQKKQLENTPEIETWESLYDYLINKEASGNVR